ncbi:MAG: ABC transporter ATP-binding protein [Firmicutes bacterium]|nr:ABC transporter ATP-binding protein [Bacillota bacterium]
MPDSDAILTFDRVSKDFVVRRRVLHAVNQVSFSIPVGKTVGLVGESGSGKSTIGRLGIGLLPATAGQVVFKGQDITRLKPNALRPLRQSMQIIFQDPQASLSPRMTVGDAIEDAMNIHGMGTPQQRKRRVEELLERVGLPVSAADAYPFELSGGQLQRVGIARALSLNPELVVCDEPVSALDVSIQIQIIQLLQDLQREYHLSYLFISHNLAVVEYLSDVVVVLYLGQIVEQAPVEELFRRATHPYTRVLMDSILRVPQPGESARRFTVLKGEVPSPFSPPSGCPFHTRCPVAIDRCSKEVPELTLIGPDHWVKCHLAESAS